MLFTLALAATASAASIKWTVNNASFQNGGTLTGSFNFDADSSTVGSFNFVTTAPLTSQPSGFTYANPDTALVISNSQLEFLTPNATNQGNLFLVFATPLTDSGGTIQLNLGSSDEGSTFGSSGYLRGFTSGSVSAATSSSAAPEPASLALAFTALGAFAAFRRRRATNTLS